MTLSGVWGRNGLGTDPRGTLSLLQDSLPVQLIATPRSAFKTCSPCELLTDVVERNRTDRFDFLPVVDLGKAPDGTILGVLQVDGLDSGARPGQGVRDHMQPLGERHLIGADASLSNFIRDADRHPFRLVVSGCEIRGLVTLSDLQQLPVRAALFAMVTQLEMTMAEVIRIRCPAQDSWMQFLSPGRADNVRKNLATARSQDTLVDAFCYTQLCDKVTILDKSLLRGSPSRAIFRRDMVVIERLRNDLAHANDYAATRDAARKVCECVRAIDSWIAALADHRVPV